MLYTILPTAIFATLALGTAIPSSPAVLTTCGIINSTISSGENVGRDTTDLSRGSCGAVEGITYYYRVDAGCVCGFYRYA
jgi:hypothetical protein